MWWLRACLGSARRSLATVVSELSLRAEHYDPPRTRKVERMERIERERKEKDAKRVTMGGSSRAQGVRDRLPSGGCRKGEKEPKKVKE